MNKMVTKKIMQCKTTLLAMLEGKEKQAFTKFKEEIITRTKNAEYKLGDSDKEKYKQIIESKTIKELLAVIKNNLEFFSVNNILNIDLICLYKNLFSEKTNTGLFNSGKCNSGLGNGGDCNSGDCNSGHRNSGNRNSGSWNSGDDNWGHCNSGRVNYGDHNSGNRNSGNRNSGDDNWGHCNSGHRNSGNRNSGSWNSGDFNSGEFNSGNRNSGVFCNRNSNTIVIFNKDSEMTWDDWENHPARKFALNLKFFQWVDWKNMSEDEKKNNLYAQQRKRKGCTKVIEYKQAWANLWQSLSQEEKNVFKTLPNFDSDIFEDITGIRF